jgi:hypothetical protein
VTFGFAELQGGGSRVRLVPALGGKITAMEIGGRQWLWTNDAITPRLPEPVTTPQAPMGAIVYAETGDSGGYDECFPTVGPCLIPTNGVKLPDHGELWMQPPTVSVETGIDGQSATCIWEGRALPYQFERLVRVTPAGDVVMRYSARNTGKVALPFIWSSHPMFPLTEHTWLDLPAGAMVRVDARHGDVMHMAEDFRWPRVRLEKTIADLSWPYAVAKQYACKLFVTMPAGPVVVGIEDNGVRLDAVFQAPDIPTVGLWINRRGWAPRKVKPYMNLGFEPCIGSPDSLATAMGPWGDAHWLQPGEARAWSLTWRAGTPRADRVSRR